MGAAWIGDFVRALVGFGDSLGVCVGVEFPLLLGRPFFLEPYEDRQKKLFNPKFMSLGHLTMIEQAWR